MCYQFDKVINTVVWLPGISVFCTSLVLPQKLLSLWPMNRRGGGAALNRGGGGGQFSLSAFFLLFSYLYLNTQYSNSRDLHLYLIPLCFHAI